MIFLVQATIQHTPYMNDAREFTDLRLVDADDKARAECKYSEFWENQGAPYSDSYFAVIKFCRPMLT